MSKYLDINELNIDDQEVLVETLQQDMKFRGCAHDGLALEVESHEDAQHLVGIGGKVRPETAEVIIRRQFVGLAANDIGFKRQESGNFKPIISGFDNGYYNEGWRDTLCQNYAARKYEKEMLQQGYILQSSTKNADGTVDMQFVEQGLY